MPTQNTSIDTQDSDAANLASIYTFLSLTMRYPDPGFCTEEFFDTLELLVTLLALADDLTALQSWRAQNPDIVDELRTEYTRLFISSASSTTIPPYASIYLDGDGTLQGRTTERTRDFYREHGFDLADDNEPADHLSLELDFLAALAGEARYEEQERFLKNLFRPWFQCFKEKSMKEARHPFYKVSIQLIDFFTKEEQ